MLVMIWPLPLDMVTSVQALFDALGLSDKSINDLIGVLACGSTNGLHVDLQTMHT